MENEEKVQDKRLKVQIINNSQFQLPEYATPGSAGMDLRADISETLVIRPGERVLVPTGIHIKLPSGYEAQVRPRSGLAFKYGITILNSPGTIDSDYTGEIGVILINLGDKTFSVGPGERIAQLVVSSYCKVEWEPVSSLDKTFRSAGGFGHTGKY